MSEFTASNGVTVSIEADHLILPPITTGLGPLTQQALREFFQKENDDRLGRWRVPGSPNWVCFPTYDADEVVVFNEEYPQHGSRLLSRGGDTWPYFRPAANAYFDSHPKPQPWDDAKQGDVWEFTIIRTSFDAEAGFPVRQMKRLFMRTTGGWRVVGRKNWFLDEEQIVSGRLVWSEVAS